MGVRKTREFGAKKGSLRSSGQPLTSSPRYTMLLVLTSTLMGWLLSSSSAYLALNRKKSISSAAASISAWMTVLPCGERSHQIKALTCQIKALNGGFLGDAAT